MKFLRENTSIVCKQSVGVITLAVITLFAIDYQSTIAYQSGCVPQPVRPLVTSFKIPAALLKKKIIYTDRGFYCNKFYVLYSANSDGSNQTALTSDQISAEYPTWSPDGTKIAFVYNGNALYVMNPDGTNPTEVTSIDVSTGFMYFPTWSKDGEQIAVTRDDKSIPPHLTTFVINLDGTHQFELPNTGGITSHVLSWSPDSSHIAFTENTSGPYEIYLMNRDGSNQVKLTDGYNPDWSPDGKHIVLVSNATHNGVLQNSIVAVDPDGSNQKLLFSVGSDQSLYSPIWSPQGDHILFSVAHSKQVTDNRADVYVMMTDGSSPVDLTLLQK